MKDIRLIFICTGLAILSGTTLLQAEKIVAENITSPVLPPVALCNNITVQLGPGGSVTITDSQIDGGSYDPDGTIVSMVAAPNTFSCSNTGPNNVTLTVTDNEGLTATCNAIVTVKDNTPPAMICKNVTLYLDQAGSAKLTVADVNNGSSDNCPGSLILYLDRTSFSCSDIGSIVPVTLTGTDASGNTSFCTSQITILDTISPHVNVKPFTLVLDPDGTATLLPSDVDNGSYDNCGPVTLSVSPNTFNCSSVGTRTVTLTATDSYGNSSSNSVNVKVESSVKIESMSLNNCDLASPYALYKANITGGDGNYTYFWDGLEDYVNPFLTIIPIPPYLMFSNTSVLETPFFNNTMPDGTYHIRLIVTDGKGCTDTSDMVINKTGPVFNNVTILYSEACEGSTDIYTINYDTASIYSWTVENGTILTSEPDTNRIEVQWNFGVPQGVVKSTAAKPNLLGDPCLSYMIDTVTIHPVPSPGFLNPVLTACSNSEYTYSLTSSFGSHIWSVTGGKIISGGSSGDSFVTVRWGPGPSGRVTVSGENSYACSGSVFIDVAVDNLSGSVISLTNISCNGGSDGKVTVEATPGSGSPPYQYSLDGGAFVPGGDFTGLTLGNHVVTIRDANFCLFDVPFVVTQPPVPLSGSTTVTNVACFGGTTGAVDLTVTGGTLPYTFLWSNGALTEDLTSVAAGVYTVTITDANLCTATALASVAQPAAALSGIAAATNVGCYGESTGEVDLTVTGGTFPYTFLWNNGAATEDLINVPAGVYSVTITDANSCTTTASATVAQPSEPLSSTASVTNVACFGEASGEIDLTVNGGTAPYSFLWSNGAVTEDLINVPAGVYSVTITDANSCTTTASATVTQPLQALSGTTNVTDVACFGDATGSVNLTVTGGTAPYTFLWSNGAMTEDLVNVTAGVYSVTITDANLCTTISSGTVTQPAAGLSVTTAVTGVACYGDATGAIDLTVTGGTMPYTFLWSNGTSTEDLINLTAGVYSVTVIDANSCTALASVSVTQPGAALNGTTVVTNVLCYGDATGAVDLTVTGGTSPYTFLWSNGEMTEDLSGIPAGTYTVTITDANLCSTTASATVTQPPELIPSAGNNGPVCVNTPLNLFGGPDAMTSYTWTGPDAFSSSVQNPLVSANATLSMAGVYSLTVMDANGCIASTTTSVSIIDLNTITLSSGAGTDDQSICINTALTDITYNTTIATGATFSGLPAGVSGTWVANVVTIYGTPAEAGVFNYTVTLTGGCGAISANGTITVNELPVSVSVIPDANPVCEGTAVTFTALPVNEGTTPLYQWQVNGINTGANSDIYSYIPLNKDVITVVLTSDAACATGNPATSDPLTMIVNPIPFLVITDPAAVCYPAAVDLTAEDVTAGSTAGLIFTYWMDAGAGIEFETPASAEAGTYYIKGTDANGCYDIKPVTVTVNPVPVLTFSQTNILCGGTSTGAIDITAAGGTEPYTYAWTGDVPAATDEDQFGLTAGLYTVIATDANNCSSAELPVTITELPALTGSVTSQTNVSFPGGNDGSLTVEGSGGTPPYRYKINEGAYQADGTFSLLTAGTYSVTIQDVNLCEFSIPVTITQPGWPLSGTIVNQTNVPCFGEAAGSITVTGLEGDPPYEYSLDGGDFQPSGTFDMLIAGPHTVTVRDILLATYDVPVLITEPLAELTVTTTQVDLLCPGASSGSASATASGGTEPYTYSWNTNPVQTGPNAAGLIAGTYTVTVTDANACVTSTDVTITEPPALIISIDQINVRCNGDANGRATANAEGGTGPYTYSWNTTPVQESATATGLARGSYTVTVTDANGCTFFTTVDITEPPTLGVTATATDALCPDSDDGEITLVITGGTEPYTIIWMDGISTQNRTDLLPGTYSVVISDANGCLVSTSVDVGFTGSYNCLLIPDIITPNNDGHNDEWIIRNIDIYPEAEILVYSRWGKLVYRTKNIADNPWNGQYRGNGELMPTDSYHYILHLNDGSKPRSGVISLIR